MESINRSAVELVDEALDFAEELGIVATELDCGATVLDFGVETDGGIEAGLMLADIQTAAEKVESVEDALGRQAKGDR